MLTSTESNEERKESARYLVRRLRSAPSSEKFEIIGQVVTYGSDAVEPLFALLDSESEARYAVRALGEIRDSRAVEPLVALLENDDSQLARAAAEALDKIGWWPPTDADHALFDYAQDNPYLVHRGRAAAVPYFLRMLADRPEEKSEEIVRYLTEVVKLYASACTTDDLQTLSKLSVSWRWTESTEPSWMDIGGYWSPATEVIEVDCSRINDLARNELLKRGVTPG